MLDTLSYGHLLLCMNIFIELMLLLLFLYFLCLHPYSIVHFWEMILYLLLLPFVCIRMLAHCDLNCREEVVLFSITQTKETGVLITPK